MLCVSLASATEKPLEIFNFVVVCRPVQPALGERFSFDMPMSKRRKRCLLKKGNEKKRESVVKYNKQTGIFILTNEKFIKRQSKWLYQVK